MNGKPNQRVGPPHDVCTDWQGGVTFYWAFYNSPDGTWSRRCSHRHRSETAAENCKELTALLNEGDATKRVMTKPCRCQFHNPLAKPFADFDYEQGFKAGANDRFWSDKRAAEAKR